MNIQNHLQRINQFIEYSNKDDRLELEMRIKDSIYDKIDKDTFIRVLKRIKGIPNMKELHPTETLEISYEYVPNKISSIRVIINNQGSIKKYCATNKLGDIRSQDIQFLKKRVVYLDSSNNVVVAAGANRENTRIYPIDINEYKFRLNLKREDILKKSIETDKIYNNWLNKQKTFRYKKRYSYITLDGLFRFDLTILKTSNKIEEFGLSKKVRKDSIPEYQKKYVIMPSDVIGKQFNEWWTELSGSDIVEMKGKKYEKYLLSRTLQESKTLVSEPSYEIELEYIGNKNKDIQSNEVVLQSMIHNIGIILQATQQSYYLTSEEDKQLVKVQLKELLGSPKFSGPMNVTLELKHIVKHAYDDYRNKELVTIRRGYTVTDKADGERNLLVILDDERLFMINRKNDIKYLGARMPGFAKTIIDGEYLNKNKRGDNISRYMAFDIYFIKGEDVRERILMRSIDEISKNQLDKSRLEYLSEIFDEINLVPDDESNRLDLFQKAFAFGDVYEYDSEISKQINTLIEAQSKVKEGSDKFQEYQANIDRLFPDTTIFQEAKKLYNANYDYHIDGLIFTPRGLEVGEELGVNKRNKFNGRWYQSFKWKPPEENTIDFAITFQTKDQDLSDEVQYVEVDSNLIAYKIATLHVGYDPKLHTKYNSCRVMNEQLMFPDKYQATSFQPTNPYVQNIHIAHLILEHGTAKCTNGDIINNNSIVEFRYDATKDKFFRWIPMRVRNTNNPNDFITASNVWNSIHNPISLEMIFTGKKLDKQQGIQYETCDSETYYRGEKQRSNYKSKPLADFHSYVKKQSIINNSSPNNVLLDIGCGKAGDLNHWIDAKISLVVGVDVSKDCLENIRNGGCNRILDKQVELKDEPLLNNVLLIWGDCGNSLQDGLAAKDDINKYYTDIVWGRISKRNITNKKLRRFHNIGSIKDGNGFDIITSQFTLHYFLKDVKTLEGFLTNVSQNLKTGGRFIGNCLDGKLVFEMLANDTVQERYIDDVLVWKITKKYKSKTFTPDESSLGLSIDVYFESINQTITEWLVNFEYLQAKALSYGLELLVLESYQSIFKTLKGKKEAYGQASNMNEELQKYSFMNKTFVFKKV